MSLRPTVITIGAPTYGLAKHLASVLSQFVRQEFLWSLLNLWTTWNLMVTLDVVSVYVCPFTFLKHLFRPEIVVLFQFALISSYFLYGENVYE